jgi:hypothetical protein
MTYMFEFLLVEVIESYIGKNVSSNKLQSQGYLFKNYNLHVLNVSGSQSLTLRVLKLPKSSSLVMDELYH